MPPVSFTKNETDQMTPDENGRPTPRLIEASRPHPRSVLEPPAGDTYLFCDQGPRFWVLEEIGFVLLFFSFFGGGFLFSAFDPPCSLSRPPRGLIHS